MTRSWLWDDDHFVAAESVPLADRGFRYGMSVFESILIDGGTAHFLGEHLERLETACARCGFVVTLPPLATVDDLLRDAYPLLMEGDAPSSPIGGADRAAPSGVESGSTGFARIYVTAGEGGVTDVLDHCRVFVFTEQRQPVQSRVYHRGYDLGVSGERHLPLLGGLKTGNYWANVLAFRAGVARQKNETLLFNGSGELISASMANVFLVRSGQILTPPISSGARDGVIRAWVLAQCHVQECALSETDVRDADEIFLTSSWLGIMPAASLEGASLRSNETAKDLLRKYRAAIAPSARPASR